jgi:2-hydroxy-3-keto-5-methylthiopentenyl-1-phosphate phosphatase
MERYDKLLTYIADALSDFDAEISIALGNMDKYRCSLSSASDTIVDVIEDAIRDYCDDNDIDYYEFDTYAEFEKDIEDIFFDALTKLDM